MPLRAVLRTLLLGCIGLVLAGGGVGSPAPGTVSIPAGAFIAGSDRAERDHAYALDRQAYGSDVTRQNRWYETERPRGTASTEAFAIMERPVTNAEYARFVRATGHRLPEVSESEWRASRLRHPYERTRRHAWTGPDGPPDRGDHPVVLVSREDAQAYARWLSIQSAEQWRLPTELEWEKAARGADGRRFPWGDAFDPDKLNSADRGPFDTMPAGSFPAGASPFGMLDAAGQVFEWTADDEGDRAVVKGGSWDDRGCGVCRPGARQTRPPSLKHILIGFRLVRESGAPEGASGPE
ncbi:MAG: formylglycine-generating enzyme family protein [Pseudomonadota bacterium]